MFTETEIDQLIYRLIQPTESLLYDSKNVKRKRYNLTQNDHPILGVAHCDYVSSAWAIPTRDGDNIVCGQVDDRVGVWLLLDILPKYLDFDVLLTTDEEIGQSTAEDVTESLMYNWTFQFDRRGTDVVDYEMSSKKFRKAFTRESGIQFGLGSFSDICSLSEESGSKINIGTGYKNEHSPDAYVNLVDCYNQMTKFLKFAVKHKDIYYPQPKVERYSPFKFYPAKQKTFSNIDLIEQQDKEELAYLGYPDLDESIKTDIELAWEK